MKPIFSLQSKTVRNLRNICRDCALPMYSKYVHRKSELQTYMLRNILFINKQIILNYFKPILIYLEIILAEDL